MKLITIDIGNTNIKCALVDLKSDQVVKTVTIPTQKNITDAYQKLISDQITKTLIQKTLNSEIIDVFLVSVVPKLNGLLSEIVKKIFNKQLLIFQPSMVGLDNNAPCGHDLIVLGLGAMEISSSSIIVSLGTATVFITTHKRSPKGVIIAPGLGVIKNALVNNVGVGDFEDYHFEKLFTTNDQQGAIIGSVFGHVGMIKYTVQSIFKALGKQVPVFITGGNRRHLQKEMGNVAGFIWVPDLLMLGMLRVYKIQRSKLMSFLIKSFVFTMRGRQKFVT